MVRMVKLQEIPYLCKNSENAVTSNSMIGESASNSKKRVGENSTNSNSMADEHAITSSSSVDGDSTTDSFNRAGESTRNQSEEKQTASAFTTANECSNGQSIRRTVSQKSSDGFDHSQVQRGEKTDHSNLVEEQTSSLEYQDVKSMCSGPSGDEFTSLPKKKVCKDSIYYIYKPAYILFLYSGLFVLRITVNNLLRPLLLNLHR